MPRGPPLKSSSSLQNTLHLVDHGVGGPLRCNRCKTYMNPFARFVDGGRQYICPICQCLNEGEKEGGSKEREGGEGERKREREGVKRGRDVRERERERGR